MILSVAFSGAVLFFLLHATTLSKAANIQDGASCTIVETIPLTNFTIELVDGGKYTHEDLISLTDSAVKTLDITVMYWNMLAAFSDDDEISNADKKKPW